MMKKMIIMINVTTTTPSEILEVIPANTMTFSQQPADFTILKTLLPLKLVALVEEELIEIFHKKEEIEDQCCTNREEPFPYLLTFSLMVFLRPQKQEET
jgi:hypothetical protein